jgi:phosphoglycolate phosphatase-like HAD superfamily hydrolase
MSNSPRMKRKARIFDIDGTLCDVSSIRHLVTGGTRNFDAFHRESINCPPHSHVVEAARNSEAEDIAPLIVTARDARYRNVTAFWLAMHHIPSEALYMRRWGDWRPDYEVKRDILARIRDRYDVVEAWDDNPNVIRLWGEEGIPYVIVPGWED